MINKNITIVELGNNEDIPFDLLLTADPSIEYIKEYTKRGVIYGAIIENELVGVYVLIKTRPDTFEIVNIAVREEFQGKGIAKELIKDAKERIKSLKAKTLEIGTGNSSINQIALYQKCGFRISGVDYNFFKRHYNNTIIENGIECIDMVRLSIDV